MQHNLWGEVAVPVCDGCMANVPIGVVKPVQFMQKVG